MRLAIHFRRQTNEQGFSAHAGLGETRRYPTESLAAGRGRSVPSDAPPARHPITQDPNPGTLFGELLAFPGQ